MVNKRENRRMRLKKLIDEKFNGVVADFAKAVDKEPNYISRMLYPLDKAQAKPIGERIVADICKALNISETWFDEIDEALPILSSLERSKYRIEILDVCTSAGNGIVAADVVHLVSAIEYTEAQYFLMFNNIPSEFIKVINVKGDSMSPTLESGDLLFVDTRVYKYDGDGIYVFSYGDNLYVKRLQLAGDEMFVISDNKAYKEWKITAENEYKFRICGKVLIGQSQSFKRYG